MQYDLAGKIAVISGGTSGIGLATARRMLSDGATVLLVGRNSDRGLAALAALSEGRERVMYVQADVSTTAGCLAVAEAVKNGSGRVDVLVNSAGIYREQRLECVTEEAYAELMEVNVKGVFFLCQALLPFLREAGATIVNIASDAALSGNYGCPVYCASKGAVMALTRALALDLAPHLRVNCVCPGDVATPMVEKQLASGTYTLKEMAEPYPLGRIGQAEEVAHVICSIASPANSYMTGAIISVDGGLTAK